MGTAIDIDQVKGILDAERVNLVYQLNELGATESGDLRPDFDFGEGFADAAAVTAERTEILGLVDNLKRQLDDVDGALAKVEDGTYGICEGCGKPIGAARMKARPMSQFCVDCKNKNNH